MENRSPRYQQLADQLQQAIEQGTYAPGERMPSVRHLQRRLNVSITTISSAYVELERRGLAEARPRSGYFARTPLKQPIPQTSAVPGEPVKVRQGPMTRAVESAAMSDALVPLAGAILDEALLPLIDIRRAARSVMREQAAAAMAYGPPAGAMPLRRALAQQPWGFAQPPGVDEILLTQGALEAISLALRTITRPGDAVVVESPSFYGFMQMIEQMGLYAMEVVTDAQHGMQPADLARALEDPRVKAVLSIPSFHNPMGAVMPEANRKEIVRLITQRQVPLIEDDIYGDLHYGGVRPTPMKAWDKEGWVIYVSSFSKVLGPGLRVGLCMPGPRFYEKMVSLKMATSLTSSMFTQLTVASLLLSGAYGRQVRHLRKALSANVQRFRHGVASAFPAETRMTHPQGGFTVWVEMPAQVDGVALYEEALAAGIAIVPGAVCSPSGRYRHCIRLSAGTLWSRRVEKAIARLGEMVHQQL
ncbi:transcriptional regulator, GntR family [Magnetococcus marinus MC-1]|uniref:Transcriptional regulator, GntR family n=1 Tax=Magnetococcus marinus (strain ATCC BAA-1437 / JCM 17883 / MC-1) TaxID=156889 RepID=A0L5P4_MAGMM|nr:PLP-dependent aminotransferase family protein [Magnetococcus marinus]ABK43287.1 transcriptional regulator, GntR family [Magnetococcus marinus MC-1]